jgi:hypothetical protein
MSTLRVNQVYFNDAANASISIANSWNVSVVSGGQEVAQFRNNGDLVANNRIVYKAGGSNEVALNTVAELAFTQGNSAYARANAVNSAVIAAFNQANTANTTAAAAGVPTGGIMYWAGETAPSGFLLCDGNIYTRATYSALASALGTPPMPSSFTFEYSNTLSSGFATASDFPHMASANNLLFLSMRSISTGNVATSGNLYTSANGTTWTPRTAASVRVYSSGTTPYLRFKNFAYAASNGANGPYVLFATSNNSFSNLIHYQTSTDQGATWTQRTLNYPRANTGIVYYPSGFASGGTQGAYLAGMGSVYTLSVGCDTFYYPGTANVAWSADGITWTAYRDLWTPFTQAQGASPVIPLFGTTPNGIVSLITISGIDTNYYGNAAYNVISSNASTLFWSANGHPSTWCDITQNVKATLGFTASAQTSPFLLNIFSCNNEIIIPAIGNKFLVSSNGANGTWRVVDHESGLYWLPFSESGGQTMPSGPSFQNLFHDYAQGRSVSTTTNAYYSSNIMHNGDVYLYQDYYFNIFYSKDLRIWFRKDDYFAPVRGGAFVQQGLVAYMGLFATLPSLKKVITLNRQLGGVFSFTTNGAYTAATQFPVPDLGSDIGATKAFNTSWVPLRPYIKT